MQNSSIAIDGGTTNTRLTLVSGHTVQGTAKYAVGVSDAVRDRAVLAGAVRDGIRELLRQTGVSETALRCILASGMITSEYGLCPLEHLNTPCGLDELAAGLYPTRLEDISSVPFAFLRGVKTGGDSWQTADMMRGEETELFGLCERPLPNALYVLPGSHSKWIHTDEAGRIADFSTQLTGELIHAVASDTILKEAVSLSRQAADAEYLENGYAYACRNGVSAAFFKVRVLKNSFGIRDDRLFSFFVGAALAPEIEHMLALPVGTIVLGGKAQLKLPMAALLRMHSEKNIEVVPDAVTEHAAAYGAVRIYERCLEIRE